MEEVQITQGLKAPAKLSNLVDYYPVIIYEGDSGIMLLHFSKKPKVFQERHSNFDVLFSSERKQFSLDFATLEVVFDTATRTQLEELRHTFPYEHSTLQMGDLRLTYRIGLKGPRGFLVNESGKDKRFSFPGGTVALDALDERKILCLKETGDLLTVGVVSGEMKVIGSVSKFFNTTLGLEDYEAEGWKNQSIHNFKVLKVEGDSILFITSHSLPDMKYEACIFVSCPGVVSLVARLDYSVYVVGTTHTGFIGIFNTTPHEHYGTSAEKGDTLCLFSFTGEILRSKQLRGRVVARMNRDGKVIAMDQAWSKGDEKTLKVFSPQLELIGTKVVKDNIQGFECLDPDTEERLVLRKKLDAAFDGKIPADLVGVVQGFF